MQFHHFVDPLKNIGGKKVGMEEDLHNWNDENLCFSSDVFRAFIIKEIEPVIFGF
jgi:hypothetical protein